MRTYDRPLVWIVAVVLLVTTVAVVVTSRRDSTSTVSHASVDAYAGLGGWVDIYDDASWGHPAATVHRLHSHGVRTLYLETSNYKISPALFDPGATGSFLDTAHADGMRVVAWTLPSLDETGSDLAKARAAIDFTSPTGQHFDGFALDIEPGRVTDASRLTSGALGLSRSLRDVAGHRYALGAIIPSPVALNQSSSLWEGFPYSQLASYYDVFLPMGYYTFQTNGPTEAATYTDSALRLLRTRLGASVAIHAVGGLAQDSDASEVKAFVSAAKAHHSIGYSLYDDATTTSAEYAALEH